LSLNLVLELEFYLVSNDEWIRLKDKIIDLFPIITIPSREKPYLTFFTKIIK